MGPVGLGYLMVFFGVVIQLWERYAQRADDDLRRTIERHATALDRGRMKTANLPDDPIKIPGTDMTFEDVKEIIVPAEERALELTQDTLDDVIKEHEEGQRRREPIFVASVALIFFGTGLTLL